MKIILKEKDNRIIEGIRMQDYASDDSFVLPNSKWDYSLGLIGAILLFVVLAFGVFVLKDNNIYGFVFGICYLLYVVYYCWKALADKEPQLIISKRGLAMKKFGFIPWSAIRKIQVGNKSSGEQSPTTLDFFLTNKKFENNPDCSLAIDSLNRDWSLVKAKFKEIGNIDVVG
ncbi:MAG: hypothetical protein ACK5RG_11240 [Cyclobacteriaceae bacterium]|jgi:hypothetical protein|nr:hypothetical protein [Flammeovirgaceae bacterium]